MVLLAPPAGAKKPCNCEKKKHAKPGTVEFTVQTARQKAGQHKFAEAEKLAREAATSPRASDEVRSKALGVLGFALGQEGKYADGIDAFKQAVNLRLNAKGKRTTVELDDIATQLQAMASMQRDAGDSAGAHKSMLRAVDLMTKAHGPNSEVTKLFRQSANAMR